LTHWENSRTETASISFRFYYSATDGYWRTSEYYSPNGGHLLTSENIGSNWGAIGNTTTEHAANAWNTCFFTDGTFKLYKDLGDQNTGMQLLVWNGFGNAARTCELTLIP
jgi:hypothetical protein